MPTARSGAPFTSDDARTALTQACSIAGLSSEGDHYTIMFAPAPTAFIAATLAEVR